MERRRFKLGLPYVVMGNVGSLSDKMDELMALTRSHPDYYERSLMCFTETWVHRDITDHIVFVDGFHTVRADRDTDSGKWKGGGLAVLVNIRWCNLGHITINSSVARMLNCWPLDSVHTICLERSRTSSLLSCTSLPLQTQHLPAVPYTPPSPNYRLNTPVPSSSCRETLTTSPWIEFCRPSNNM